MNVKNALFSFLHRIVDSIDRIREKHDRSHKLYANYDFEEHLSETDLLNEEMRCGICGRKVTINEVSCTYPTSEGLRICCDRTECFSRVLWSE